MAEVREEGAEVEGVDGPELDEGRDVMAAKNVVRHKSRQSALAARYCYRVNMASADVCVAYRRSDSNSLTVECCLYRASP